MCGLLSLSVMPDRPSPRPPVIDWPFYMARFAGQPILMAPQRFRTELRQAATVPRPYAKLRLNR